ncbi:MAG: hypothetical protein WBH47_27035, partial [Streptosporangiaceae bacterium]
MSDTNSPDASGGDSGTSWPEYLGRAAGAGGVNPGGAGAGGSGQPEPEGPRHRVIGTPSPAAARTLLPEPGGVGRQPRQPEL